MIGNTKILALCSSKINELTTQKLVRELNKRLTDIGWRLFVYHLSSDYEWLNEYMSADKSVFDLIDYDVIDALVLVDDKLKDKELAKRVISSANEHNIPAILHGCDYEGGIRLVFDTKKGFGAVVRHVFDTHNVKDVHFMAGYKGNVFSDERIAIFKEVLAENHIRFNEDMISYGNFWSTPTVEAMEALLARRDVPEAIICANDAMAISVCQVLNEHGYKVPDDVLVTGYDGIDEIFYFQPKITSVMCDQAVVADRICQIVRDWSDGVDIERENYIVPQLVIGNSCGCTNCSGLPSHLSNNVNSRLYCYQDFNTLLSYAAEKMQNSEQLDDFLKVFDWDAFDHMIIVLNNSCFDERMCLLDLPEDEGSHTYEQKLTVIRHPDQKGVKPYEIKTDEVYKYIGYLLDKKVPIIFNALCSMNRLLGFAAFTYDNDDMISFGNIPQIVASISNGISGYMNMCHQRYMHRELERIYKYDGLTGLLNRKGFDEEYEKLCEAVIEDHDMITVMLSDLDGLKPINDNYGHLTGDKAITAVADAIKNCCPEGALCMRLGGDEMLAVIKGQIDVDKILKDISDYLVEYNKTSGLPCTVSSSIGVHQSKNAEELDLEKLILKVDKAMYKNKVAKKAAKKSE